jgi:carotenoid cleavage dioxygenase-like enzyme
MSGLNRLVRSLKQSTDKPVQTKIYGEIPKWLNGTLFRNGPGRYEFNNQTYHHLFDGQACVHKFQIQNGNVFYSNKLLETKSYMKTLQTNKLYPMFGTPDYNNNIFKRFKSFLKPDTNDNVNVNVVPYSKEQLFALTETNMFCQLDPSDLSILDTKNISTKFSSLKSIIAHPHVERDGTWINMGLSMNGRQPCYEFIRLKGGEKDVDAIKNAQSIARIPSTRSKGPSYFHAFGLSQNYIIFLEQALTISFRDMIKVLIKNEPRSKALIMEPNEPTRIHIINKHTGEVLSQKYITDPQFAFHYINAYEKDNEIRLDLCSYDAKYFDINSFSSQNSYSEDSLASRDMKLLGRRITIPLNKQDSKEIYCPIKDIHSELKFELPTINYWRYNTLPYNYVYGINHYKSPFSVIKLNVENPNDLKEQKYSESDFKFLPSEPVFVEKPNPTSEDDGVVLVMVLSDKNDYLSILDAKSFSEIARAEFPADVKGAFTFHGFFADSMEFKSLNTSV